MIMVRFKQMGFASVFALAQLAFVGWLDYVTGNEVSVAIFYYVPIAYAAWNLGWGWSFGISTLSALTLTWVELLSGRHYSHEWIIAERTFMRLIVFGFVAFSFNYFKSTIEKEREKVRRLEGILTSCSCCRKVRDDQGNWSELDAYLRENTDVQPQTKLCPTCARETYAEGGKRPAGHGNRVPGDSSQPVKG
jgi:hypothetical protein